MKYTLSIAIGCLAVMVIISCGKNQLSQINNQIDPLLPEISYDYRAENEKINNLSLPSFFQLNSINTSFQSSEFFNGFGTPIKTKVDNNEAATLGRVLFYDGQLSKNNATACASCHQQSKAFADGVDLSQGFGGKLTTRNSMSFTNLATNNNFFWDSRQSVSIRLSTT